MIDMLSLTKYYRVNFKKRTTVEKFISHLAFLAEQKENEVFTGEQLNTMHKIADDLTLWIDKRKCECIDDSHWPVSNKSIFNLKAIYTAFPAWQNQVYHRLIEWHDRLLDIKEELQRETTPERGLSLKDIFDAHLNYYRQQWGENFHVHEHVSPGPCPVSDVQMYTDGNLNPPRLQNDTDTDYTVV